MDEKGVELRELLTQEKVLKYAYHGRLDELTEDQKKTYEPMARDQIKLRLDEIQRKLKELKKEYKKEESREFREWLEHDENMKASYMAGGLNLGQFEDDWEKES